MVALMMFAGFFKSLDSLPSWFGWIQYLSPFKYGYEMLLVNEYTGLPFECADICIEPDRCIPFCPIDSGDQLLNFLGLTYWDLWAAAVALAIQTLAWNLLAYLVLNFWYAARARGGARR